MAGLERCSLHRPDPIHETRLPGASIMAVVDLILPPNFINNPTEIPIRANRRFVNCLNKEYERLRAIAYAGKSDIIGSVNVRVRCASD
jgi:hypothetical protein